jgi:hypothetical protein
MTAMKFEDQDLSELNDHAARAEQYVPVFRGLATKGWLAFA